MYIVYMGVGMAEGFPHCLVPKVLDLFHSPISWGVNFINPWVLKVLTKFLEDLENWKIIYFKNSHPCHSTVQTVWEGHKNWKNLRPVLTKQSFLLCSIETNWRFFQIFVAFSEKVNFSNFTSWGIFHFSSIIHNQNISGNLRFHKEFLKLFTMKKKRVISLQTPPKIHQGPWEIDFILLVPWGMLNCHSLIAALVKSPWWNVFPSCVLRAH